MLSSYKYESSCFSFKDKGVVHFCLPYMSQMLFSHFQSIIQGKKFSRTTFHYSFVASAAQETALGKNLTKVSIR